MSTDVIEAKETTKKAATDAFKAGLWTKEINVRNFMQHNYEPYYGDESFLAGPTKRTLGIWKKLTDLFVEERKKGVLDVSQIPSSIRRTTPATSTRRTRSSSDCRRTRR